MFRFIIGFILGFYVAMYGVSAVFDRIVSTFSDAKQYVEEYEESDTPAEPDISV